jgi:hypothetical protein
MIQYSKMNQTGSNLQKFGNGDIFQYIFEKNNGAESKTKKDSAKNQECFKNFQVLYS